MSVENCKNVDELHIRTVPFKEFVFLSLNERKIPKILRCYFNIEKISSKFGENKFF